MANILIHSLVFSPDGVSTAYLYSELALELRKKGHKIVVLSTTPHNNIVQTAFSKQPLQKTKTDWLYRSNYEGIDVWHIKMPLKTGKTIERVKEMLLFHGRALHFDSITEMDFDIVLSPSPPLTIGIVSSIMAKKKNAKCIYNIQEIFPDSVINRGLIKNKIIIQSLKLSERYVYLKSDKLVTIGDRFTKIIRERVRDRDKVVTIPNFVDIDFYKPISRRNSFAKENDLENDFVIMYAGNIGYAQEWRPLIEAAQHLSGLKIKFVIIGDGVQKKWIREQIEEKKLKNVLLMDYQPREKMAMINASSDIATILMDSSITEEGFPSKIYTTMACEKPTVAYCAKNTELKEIIEKSQCGTWVADGDAEGYKKAIEKYYHNREKIEVEGKRGREFVKKYYSKKTVCEMYHELILKMTGEQKIITA